jgi:hypothetical protein
MGELDIAVPSLQFRIRKKLAVFGPNRYYLVVVYHYQLLGTSVGSYFQLSVVSFQLLILNSDSISISDSISVHRTCDFSVT